MKKPTKEQLEKDLQTNMTWAEIAKKYGYTDARFIRKLRVRYGLPQRRIYRKPSPEELQHMICEERMSPYEIAKKLGYSKDGWSNIYKYCRDYGIPVDFKPHYEERNRPLTTKQKSIVYGTLLGDGYINSDNYLAITHGEKQLDYINWLGEMLKPYVIGIDKRHPSKNSIYSQKPTYTIKTIAHPWIVEIRKLCYPNGKKVISKEWLNKIDELALAVWFMDDGSLNKRYGTMVFCTMSFSYDEHLLIQKWFFDKWGIETKIEKRRNNTYVIRINASKAHLLRKIISPHVPSCMKYKVTMG